MAASRRLGCELKEKVRNIPATILPNVSQYSRSPVSAGRRNIIMSIAGTSISAVMLFWLSSTAVAMCPYDYNCLNNPYGAGNPYKSDGLMNPYSEYGSRYSNKSWTNPYATDAPKIVDQNGNYRGRLS